MPIKHCSAVHFCVSGDQQQLSYFCDLFISVPVEVGLKDFFLIFRMDSVSLVTKNEQGKTH